MKTTNKTEEMNVSPQMATTTEEMAVAVKETDVKPFENINLDDKFPVSGRSLHEKLKIATRYNDWFKRMIDYGFTEGVDFNLLKNEQVQIEGTREVKREIIDHQLTIDMAKHVCMIQRSEIGKKIRQYFIDVENKWRQELKKPMTLVEMFSLQAKINEEYYKKMLALEEKTDNQGSRLTA